MFVRISIPSLAMSLCLMRSIGSVMASPGVKEEMTAGTSNIDNFIADTKACSGRDEDSCTARGIEPISCVIGSGGGDCPNTTSSVGIKAVVAEILQHRNPNAKPSGRTVVIFVASLLVGYAALCFIYFVRTSLATSRRKRSAPFEGFGCAINLQKHEKSGRGLWSYPATCTVTFCDGDVRATLTSLRTRVRACLLKNPWIAGRLDANKRLVFPWSEDAVSCVDEILSSTRCSTVSRSTPYPKLLKATGGSRSLCVGSGGNLQKTGGRVSKIVVVEPEVAEAEFAIVFSMAHAVADAHTYYRIFDMIFGGAEVVELQPQRVAEFEARQAELITSDSGWIISSAGLKGMLGGWIFGPKGEWCCHQVDHEKIASAKDRASASASNDDASLRLSTNDVLTSHFCNAASARIALMAINLRGKIDIPISEDHAGNYVQSFLLDEPNYRNPTDVRTCLNKGAPFMRQAKEFLPLPKIFDSCPIAAISNWASFKWDVAVEGVERLVLHLPCVAVADMVDFAFVFTPHPGELGAMYLAKRAKGKLLGEGTVLGGTIDSGVFPQK